MNPGADFHELGRRVYGLGRRKGVLRAAFLPKSGTKAAFPSASQGNSRDAPYTRGSNS